MKGAVTQVERLKVWKNTTDQIIKKGLTRNLVNLWVGEVNGELIARKVLTRTEPNKRWSIPPRDKVTFDALSDCEQPIPIYIIYGINYSIDGVNWEFHPSSFHRTWEDLRTSKPYLLPINCDRGRIHPQGFHCELPQRPGKNWYFIDGPKDEMWLTEATELIKEVKARFTDKGLKFEMIVEDWERLK